MKIMMSATGKDIDSNIDSTFGRCRFFLIVDIKTKEVKAIVNKVRDRPSGAGITATNIVAKEEVDVVITSDIGPSSFEILKRRGITMYQAEGKIDDSIQQFESGKLSEITEPTAPKYKGLK
jgi:predicted Fe-Mo cluster-binding NifX family protein